MCQPTVRVLCCASKKKGNEVQQKPFVMTFADTIERFGSRMEQGGLADTYKRAGRASHGQFEQHFVVLKDNPQATPPYPVPETVGQAKKRPLEDQTALLAEALVGC
jgi:hypothetical protein